MFAMFGMDESGLSSARDHSHEGFGRGLSDEKSHEFEILEFSRPEMDVLKESALAAFIIV